MANRIVSVREITDPKEIEEGFKKSYPQVLYKYRRWDDPNHQKSLTTPSIWYGHPKSFNDEQDIRVPYVINYDEVNDDRFPARFEEFFQTRLVPGTREYQISLENSIEIVRNDPKKWFDKNAQDLRNGPLYDSIGVFSLSEDILNAPMWGYYANDNKGFCIGYSPVVIFLNHHCTLYKVEYSKVGIQYSLLEPRDMWDFRDFYLKAEKWQHEAEFRFITYVDTQEERLKVIPRAAIVSVTLGCNISEEDTKEIIKVLKIDYASTVELYKINVSVAGFGYDRVKLDY